MKPKIKLFISDVDGTLTDGTMYVSERGEELKQFSHKDGRGFYLLKERGIKCVWITSETAGINRKRFEKLNTLGSVQEYFDGATLGSKKEHIEILCKKYGITKDEVAFIGDDTNDLEAMEYVDYKACPKDANYLAKKIKGIHIMNAKGGQGAVREWIDLLIRMELV